MDVYKYLEKHFELIKKEEYRSYDLSTENKKILCDIGIPKEPLPFLQFNTETIEGIQLDTEYIPIGNDDGTIICINKNDEIISVDPEKEYPIRYINKNLKTLLQFIVIYISYEDKLIDSNDAEINKVIAEIKEEFEKIDIKALNNDENWWSVILEQVELGLM